MINQQTAQQTFQPTWQAFTWRILFTLLLLIVLAGPGMTAFNTAVATSSTVDTPSAISYTILP